MIVPRSCTEIAEFARRQRTGGYSTSSDALTALDLIERLARLTGGERPRNAFDEAHAALIGNRWTRAEADALILLIEQGAATLTR